MAGQHRKPRARAHRLLQHQPIVHPDRGPRAVEQIEDPALTGHVIVVVVEADPGQAAELLAGEALRRSPSGAIDRIGRAAEPAGDDAAEIGHLLADQEIGLAAGEIGQHVAGRQLDLDALQLGGAAAADGGR